MNTLTMKPITSDSLHSNDDLRQWIEELTNYTPQQIDEILEHIKENYNPTQSKSL